MEYIEWAHRAHAIDTYIKDYEAEHGPLPAHLAEETAEMWREANERYRAWPTENNV
ncbi:hypothetical protein [Salinactinospora qingdaonensis]|uniref:Uncharacterized protein n=1 Tax=Salinactinospora qingdaonensis TaxID=702744 RepID=A0ABP7F1G0_9ACTN